MGFFKEALSITNSMQQKQLSPKLKAEYFLGQVTIYNHQKAFASNEDDSQKNDLIAQIYRDSLLQCKEVPSNVRAFITAPTLLFHKSMMMLFIYWTALIKVIHPIQEMPES